MALINPNGKYQRIDDTELQNLPPASESTDHIDENVPKTSQSISRSGTTYQDEPIRGDTEPLYKKLDYNNPMRIGLEARDEANSVVVTDTPNNPLLSCHNELCK
jgi:hypothetical protein